MNKALGSKPRTPYIGFTVKPTLTPEVEAVGTEVWFGPLREFEVSPRHTRETLSQTTLKQEMVMTCHCTPRTPPTEVREPWFSASLTLPASPECSVKMAGLREALEMFAGIPTVKTLGCIGFR